MGPAGDWGNYPKSYDENRSAIQYWWWPGTCWWLGKFFEKIWRKQICHTIHLLMVTWDLPAGDWGNYSKRYDENRSAIQYCWWPGTCWWPIRLRAGFVHPWRSDRIWFSSCNAVKNYSRDYPRDSRFSTICAKIYILSLIIEKVTVSITFFF